MDPPAAGSRSGSRGAGRSTTGQHQRICHALRFQISNVMLQCDLWNMTSAETMLRLHNGFPERKTVNVSWREGGGGEGGKGGRPQALTIGVSEMF